MYTNELLEEKYKAQKKLVERAEKEKKDYFKVIEEEVKELYEKNGWKLKFSTRKGGFLKRAPGPRETSAKTFYYFHHWLTPVYRPRS